MALYGLSWQNIVFSRGHRFKFIWSFCSKPSHLNDKVVWLALPETEFFPPKSVFIPSAILPVSQKKRRSVVYAVVGGAVAFERAGRGLFPALPFAGFCYCVL